MKRIKSNSIKKFELSFSRIKPSLETYQKARLNSSFRAAYEPSWDSFNYIFIYKTRYGGSPHVLFPILYNKKFALDKFLQHLNKQMDRIIIKLSILPKVRLAVPQTKSQQKCIVLERFNNVKIEHETTYQKRSSHRRKSIKLTKRTGEPLKLMDTRLRRGYKWVFKEVHNWTRMQSEFFKKKYIDSLFEVWN